MTSKHPPLEGTQFSREEVFRVLCVLNDNLGSIRDVKLSQGSEQYRRSGLNVLSDVLGEDFPRSKIRAIISYLWRQYRDPSSSYTPNHLYRYGAFPRTLPGLEMDFPGLLDEVCCSVKKQQEYYI